MMQANKMEFNIATYNCRGLTNLVERIKAKCFVHDLLDPLDVLSGQEYKARRQNLGWLDSIWPLAEFISAAAIDGKNAYRNPHVPAGHGGVFLATSPRLKASIPDMGFVPSQCVVWVHIDHPTLGNIGILAIYVPNGKNERAMFWHELANLMDKKRDWIVIGDMNMVEKSID